jgi:hypothetical protein
VARNPFFNAEPDAPIRAPVEAALVALRSFLSTRSLPALRTKLVRAGLAQAVADTVVRLDDIPDPVVNFLLNRIPDVTVRNEVRRRLRLL